MQAPKPPAHVVLYDKRPTKQELHLETAFLWALRSTCKQENRNVGCIITDKYMRCVLAVGYNGPPSAMPNDGCRGLSGNCGCVHAEQNAIAIVDGTIENKIMFLTMEPCEACANLIAQANIYKVYYCEPYRNTAGLFRLGKCGIELFQLQRKKSWWKT